MKTVAVWDLPTRVFHWALVLALIGLFITGKLGGNWMEWHRLLGFFVLGLIAFRIAWGVVGGFHSRFVNFVRGPRAIMAYLRGDSGSTIGHNPLGALSVLALLTVVGFQAVSGLFADDEVLMQGPYVSAVSSAFSATMTRWHHWNSNIILGLVALHVLAIIFYTWVKREKLLGAMVSGKKNLVVEQNSSNGELFQAEVAEKARPIWVFWLVAVSVAISTWAVVTRQLG